MTAAVVLQILAVVLVVAVMVETLIDGSTLPGQHRKRRDSEWV